MKNKAKTLEDIFNNGQYIIRDEVNFNKDDVKLIDDKARKVISDFNAQFKKIDLPSREILEPIVNGLIKSHDTNFKGVGQPLRIALTGSKFGPGIYDIILSLTSIKNNIIFYVNIFIFKCIRKYVLVDFKSYFKFQS